LREVLGGLDNLDARGRDGGAEHVAGAMTAQIDRDRLVPRGQMQDLRVPIGVVAGETVHERHGRVRVSGDDVVDRGHGRGFLSDNVKFGGAGLFVNKGKHALDC
jgi:hypothetical protein